MSTGELVTPLLLATVLLYIVGRVVAAHFLVDDRRFEKGASYTAETFGAWVKADPGRACRYAFPVLFPLDLLFMLTLGGLLAAGSAALAASIGWSSRLVCLSVLLPGLYVVADLGEDMLLAALLTSPDRIGAGVICASLRLNRVKRGAIALAVLQVFGLLVAGTWMRCS